MGVNFYALDDKCRCCNQRLPEASQMTSIHLGKSSMGWKFTLQLNGKKYYKNWLEMKGWLVGRKILDEYQKIISLEEFVEWVESRQDTKNPVDIGYIVIDGYNFLDHEFS